MLGKALLAKLAIGATGVLGATGAAAAAGALPGPAQSSVSGVLAQVGVSVPDSAEHHEATTTNAATEPTTETTSATTTTEVDTKDTETTDTTSTTTKGPDPNGPAGAGLCQAVASGAGGDHGNKLESTAFRALADAADAQHESVDDFCKTVEARDTKHDDHQGQAQPEADHSRHGHDTETSTPTTGAAVPSDNGSSRGGDNHSGGNVDNSGHGEGNSGRNGGGHGND